MGPMNHNHNGSGPLASPALDAGHSRGLEAGSNAAELLLLLETILRRWRWLLAGGVALAALGFAFGMMYWQSSYTAPAQLIRYDSPNAEQVFGPRQVAPETLPSILRSAELLERAGAAAKPPISADVLLNNLRVMPEHDSEIIVVAITGREPEATLKLVNLYAAQAVRFTQEMQAKAAAEVIQFTAQQLAQIESEIDRQVTPVQNSTRPASPPPPLAPVLPPRASALAAKYQAACDELADLLGRYTDAHPAVQAKRAEIAALEKEGASLRPALGAAGGGSSSQSAEPSTTRATAGGAPESVSAPDPEREVLVSKLQTLESARLTLIGRKQAAEALAANPPGYCQLLASATPRDLVKQGRRAKVLFLTVFLGMIGLVGAAATVLAVEFMDDRVKTAADLRRVARLPLLGAAGDFARMTRAQQEHWAFRAWTSLQGRLSLSPNRGLVCGITSAGYGEGRSAWVNQLARAASHLGFRVLTISTRRAEATVEADAAASQPESETDSRRLAASGRAGASGEADSAHCDLRLDGPENQQTGLQQNVLASPAEVAQKLLGPERQPIVHIPLPGWVWNLERRKQWQAAVRDWSQIENVVIFIELPPASEPEAVLLAEYLPNVIWLAASSQAGAAETRDQLETLRHARCKLAGAVLNRAPASFFQRRFCRWFNYAAVLFALNLSLAGAAEEALPPPATNQTAQTPLSFTVVSRVQRAPWQQHLTLGAGDLVNLSLYGEPALTETAVPIGPDGRLSFLEAQDVQAAGLTVDELRARMDEALAKYRRAPRTVITPAEFTSKKYFLLGSVAREGVFTLDRPITIVEAVARARGLQTAVQQRELVEVADLQRAFLVRERARLPVDFEKLFQRGDLSQNIPLAPDDYLYFPPADPKQVYVLGEVLTPGIARWTAETSALRAIAEQGGFTPRAWKKKLLVIRGSLNHPQAFVVDADAVLSARAADFKLEPDDIVYVHHRPWIKAEEVLDLAATSFVESAVIFWTGIHAGPIITHPIF